MMRFLFFIPNNTVVRGGISVIIDVIAALNAKGIDAIALYDRPDFEYNSYVIKAPRLWSSHVQRPKMKFDIKSIFKSIRHDILYSTQKPAGNAKPCAEWQFKVGDVLIVPEYVSDWMPHMIPKEIPIILFNQNPFALLRAYMSSEFRHNRFVGSISVSEACSAGCRMILGNKDRNIPLFISEELFAFQEEKIFQIAYMPRKRRKDSLIIIKALRETIGFENIPFVEIDGVTNVEAAKIIRESLFFLSFSEREGFGLPAAEAMGTGAIVIGYSGIGGDEFFDETTGFRIDEDNLMKFYFTSVDIILGYLREQEKFDRRRRLASKIILQKYNYPTFEKKVFEVFSGLQEEINS